MSATAQATTVALWDHQTEAVEHAVGRPAAMLAMPMGVGKTLSTIAIVGERGWARTLILAPKSVVPHWPREFAKFAAYPVRCIALDERKSVAQRVAQAEAAARLPGPLVIVTNHEAAWRPQFSKFVEGWRPECLVVDESHRAKDPWGAFSKWLGKYAPLFRQRIGLTGTPMPHALPVESRVLTPSGWRPIGQLRIGDSVIGSSGKPTEVVGVWPQGVQPLYSVRFSDGASVECTGDHLWQVTTRGRTSRGLPPLVRRTEELADPLPLPNSNGKPRIGATRSLFDLYGAARWSIPLSGIIELESRETPIDPYVMGLLLGDGSLGRPLSYTTADPELAVGMEALLPQGIGLIRHEGGSRGRATDYRLSSGKRGGSLKGPKRGPAENPVAVALDELGLRFHRSEDKFIPESYLWNSAENRLALLQGLCDTDGSSYRSTTKFTTTSERLAEGVAFLVRSLGGLVQTVVEPSRETTLPNGNSTIGRPKFCLYFRIPVNPFRLERKREKYCISPRTPRRSIVAVEPAGAGEALCITVAAPDGLYVVEDFVVTHNSPLDVFAQYRFLDSRIFGHSFARFRTRYGIMGGWQGKQVVGYQNTDELAEKFRSIAYECGADVVSLPETVDTTRTVQLGQRAALLYKQIARDFWAGVESGEITASNALTRMLRLQQVTGGHVGLDLEDGEYAKDRRVEHVDTAKQDALRSVLEDLPQGEPVIVFARFAADLDSIHAAAKAAGRSSAELSGRRRELEDWQRGGAEVLATQVQAGGVGVDLTRARVCVYYSLGFSLGEYLQSRKRTHRPGQTRSVLYVHLVAEGTIDEQVYRALEARQSVIEAVLSSGR